MNRWRKVVLPVAGLALLWMVACSDAPSDSGGPEPVGDPFEAVLESTGVADQGPPPTVQASTGPDGRHGGTVPTSTLPITVPASEDEVIREEVSPPIIEPVEQPENVPPIEDGEEAPATVEDPRPDPAESVPEISVSSLSPATDILLSGSYRPDIDVSFNDGEIRATVIGSIGPSRRLAYTVHAAEGQSLVATVDAPHGVWIELSLGEDVIFARQEQSQRVETALPSGGPWRVGMISTAEDSIDYTLTIRIVPPEPQPEPVPEPEPEPAKPVARRSAITTGDVVYLTFDDGPHPSNTPQVLDILARHGAKATFFVLGSLVERHPDLFQRIVAEGHTVANHTWKHENLAKLSREEFDRTISRTQEILGEHATPCLRPPYAATNRHTRAWAAEHGLEVHLWSVSANDWLGLNGEEIANRIVGQVTNGSVVLMHDGGGRRPATVRGLEIVLDRLSGLELRYEPLCR